MDYNEDDIIKKIKEWQPDVDTHQLWNAVCHEAPIVKRRRRCFVLPLFLGLILGGIAVHFFGQHYHKNLICEESELVDSLRKELTLAHNQIHNLVGELHTNQKEKIIIAPARSPFPSTTAKILQERSSVPESKETKLFVNAVQQMASEVSIPKEVLLYYPIDKLHITPHYSKDKVEMPGILIKETNFNNPVKGFLKTFDIGLGWAYVIGENKISPSKEFQAHRLPSNVQYLSWEVSKNINEYLSTGLGLQLWRTQSAFNYNYSHQEEFEVIDTTQLIIDPAGNISSVIGSTTAIKFEETQGTFYLSDYRLGILPSLTVKWPLAGLWNFEHKVGIGTDLFQINERTPAFLSDAGLWSARKSGLVLNPYITLSHSASYRLQNHDRAYIVFSLLYRKEKLPTQNSASVHNLLIPTIGFGLSFEGRR